MAGPRVIKKYENRRLYDTEESGYINLEQVARLIREGQEVRVVDAKTGEDLTRHVLTQIIVDDSRDKRGGPPLDFLRDLIKTRDDAQKDFLQWYLSTAADAYRKVQEAWPTPSWPTLGDQRKAWAKMFDPLGTMQSAMRSARGNSAPKEEPQPDEPAEPDGSEARASANDDLADLKKRLEELEARLSGG